jgi:hypothetical protein
MRPEELDRLLWQDVEGELTAADRARLAAVLAADPDAARRRREVAACADLLAAVEEVPAPPALQASIERAVAARPHPRRRAAWREALAALFAPQRRTRLAWATAGVLVGVVATLLLLNGDPGRAPGGGDERFYGALVAGTAAPARPGTAALPDGLGSITLSVREGTLLCQLRLDRVVPGGVTLDVTGVGVTVGGFEADGVGASQIASAPDAVGVRVEGVGAASLTVRVGESPQDVTVRVVSAGGTVFERKVDITAASER